MLKLLTFFTGGAIIFYRIVALSKRQNLSATKLKEKEMKKSYLEPTLTIENFLTEDVMVASFDSNNSADFPLDWFNA